jgi:hypothetical protein
MAFTMHEIEAPAPGNQPTTRMKEFDLPSKEFTGYDPKGTTTITGSDRKIPEAAENAGQETKVETTEEIELKSPKISALLRKEQAQRQRELNLKKREQELEDKLKKAERFEQLTKKIEAKDYSAADELGLSYDEYTRHQIESQAAKDPQEEKYRNLDEKLAQVAKKQEELEVREYQANQGLWKQEILSVVSGKDQLIDYSKPENDFSSILAEGKAAEDAVLHLINDSFEEDGIEYTTVEAARLVEQWLVERGERFASYPKLQKKFGEKLGPPKSSPKTLTQQMTVTSQKQSQKPFHLMSESEQLAEAIRRVNEAKLQR